MGKPYKPHTLYTMTHALSLYAPSKGKTVLAQHVFVSIRVCEAWGKLEGSHLAICPELHEVTSREYQKRLQGHIFNLFSTSDIIQLLHKYEGKYVYTLLYMYSELLQLLF